jgi:hypothetical protein
VQLVGELATAEQDVLLRHRGKDGRFRERVEE